MYTLCIIVSNTVRTPVLALYKMCKHHADNGTCNTSVDRKASTGKCLVMTTTNRTANVQTHLDSHVQTLLFPGRETP